MPMSIRDLAAASLLTVSSVLSSPAQAQDEGGRASVTLSGSASVVSDYRYRGVSRSGGDVAVQGNITAAHDSGFYAGTWASSIDDGGTDAYGEVELDLFAGWSGGLSEGIGLDVGLLYYAFPTNARGFDAEYFEPYATVSGQLGPVQAKLGANYAWKQDALGGGDNLYLHTELNSGIPTTPVTVSAHLGYTDGALAPSVLAGFTDDTGFDWSLGASAVVLRGVTLGVSYVGVGGPAIDGLTDDTVVVSVAASF